jgi:hypothetical protein
MTSDPDSEHSPEVTIRDRAHEAHRMHLGGSDWPAIAAALGYASGKSAAMAVTAYLQRAGLTHSKEENQLALRLELDRLDALQLGLWDKAVGGDLKAAAFVVGLIERRVKLLGLDRLDGDREQVSPYALVLDK